MSGAGIGFRRMVLGLPQGSVNRAAVDAAADLAEFLNIELLATYVADPTLPALAGLSGARELRTLGQGWQPIDRAQITCDIDRAVSVARRRFAESVSSRSIKTSFDVLTGAEAIASLIRFDDIVAVLEPAHPGETITRQFTGLLEAAFEMAAPVLVVPRRIARTTGPNRGGSHRFGRAQRSRRSGDRGGAQGALDHCNDCWHAPADQGARRCETARRPSRAYRWRWPVGGRVVARRISQLA